MEGSQLMSKMFVATTVGNTMYLPEWLKGVRCLSPMKIVISMDDSRHGEVPKELPCEIIHYDSGKVWEGYQERHRGWVSDYSIGLGIKALLENFTSSDCDLFVCIDSDVIIDAPIATKIRKLDFDYLRIGVPAVSRFNLRLLYLHWKSTNFGVSKEVAGKLQPMLNYDLSTARPVDLKLHHAIQTLNPKKFASIKSLGLAHYLNSGLKTKKISTLEAEVRSVYSKPCILLYEKLIHPPMYPS
jgi:hypothetical protein